MNKKYLKPLIYILIALLILGLAAYFLVTRTNLISNKNKVAAVTNTKPIEIMTKDEMTASHVYHLGVYQVLTRDNTGKPTSYRFVGVKEPAKISKDLMTDEEKKTFNLASSTKVQVLERDKNGKIVNYRIMKSDSDVLSLY